MRVRRNDRNGDWVFGLGRQDYITDSQAIGQNIKTRLQSFKRDWFLDSQANIEWVGLLGMIKNERAVLREVERVTLQTEGVLRLDKVEMQIKRRVATITISYTDIYNVSDTINLEVQP